MLARAKGPCYGSPVFGLGFWEIAVIVILAVMLFPPTEIPKLARSVAKTYGSVRRTAEEFRNQIMHDEDLRAPLDEVRSAYNDARWQVKKVEQSARDELRKAEKEARAAASITTQTVAAGSPNPYADAPEDGDGDDPTLGVEPDRDEELNLDSRFDAGSEDILHATPDPDADESDPDAHLPTLAAPPRVGGGSRAV